LFDEANELKKRPPFMTEIYLAAARTLAKYCRKL